MKKFLVFTLLAISLYPFAASAAITNIWEGTSNGGCNLRGNTCTICDGIIVSVNIIELLLLLGVIIAVLMVFYGAVRLMTSGGSQTQISQGKDIITKALIGLLIVSLAWVIVNTVFRVLTTKTKWNTLNLVCEKQKQPEEGKRNEGK